MRLAGSVADVSPSFPQAVRLESTYQNRTRYMVVVSTNGRQDTEESIVLGMDFSSNDRYSRCLGGEVLVFTHVVRKV